MAEEIKHSDTITEDEFNKWLEEQVWASPYRGSEHKFVPDTPANRALLKTVLELHDKDFSLNELQESLERNKPE